MELYVPALHIHSASLPAAQLFRPHQTKEWPSRPSVNSLTHLSVAAAGVSVIRHSRTVRRALRLTPASPSQFLDQSPPNIRTMEPARQNQELWDKAKMPSDDDHTAFARHKARTLEKTLLQDKSPKGSVDERLVDVIAALNAKDEFVTTSSCSGRVLFVSYGATNCESELVLPGAQTHTGRWCITHDEIRDAAAYFDLHQESLQQHLASLWLHMQPLELQVACASPAAANRLVAACKKVLSRVYVKSAAREWKTLIFMEGNQRIEMPFALSGKQVYSGSLDTLASLVNAKLNRNWEDIRSLLHVFQDLD